MITEITSPTECVQALNENLSGLLNGKRKIPIVKEVNNTIGKLLDVHRLEAISKSLSGDKSGLTWFDTNTKLISNNGMQDDYDEGKFTKTKKALGAKG